jgi:hypothetical protein
MRDECSWWYTHLYVLILFQGVVVHKNIGEWSREQDLARKKRVASQNARTQDTGNKTQRKH